MEKIEPKKYKVIVSSGHINFHMLFTASELYKRGLLLVLFCGAYPKKWERYFFSKVKNKKLLRFLNRRENIPDEMVCQNRISEFIDSIGLFLRRFTGQYYIKFIKLAFDFYGWIVKLKIKNYNSNAVYHYRAGYGQSSIQQAKKKGMVTICDHSIAHPALINVLIENNGMYPDFPPTEENIGFWEFILDDIHAADYTLVNSDFVKETFVYMGYDASKIHVIYQGVEDKFFKNLPMRKLKDQSDRIRFLFAGGISDRKGIKFLIDAIDNLNSYDFEFHFAGVVQHNMVQDSTILFESSKVFYHGMLSQSEIAKLMSESDVFVFPSLVEGSARVVFEAMAAGCAIITTPNAGSININDETGLLIMPGDSKAISNAMMYFINNPQMCYSMGKKASKLVKEKYTQKNYGDALERFYINCLNEK